ncbi:hypothetical protein [Dactylosporangium sp. NPDC051541]|uniref:hypothetical protein n=1 Tax=Dactylosporangium sp. NPDC051541 TaxID=3363977 RepID=UPI00379327BF
MLLIAAALVANIAFIGLGSAFDYPAILQRPPAEVLERFHDNPAVIGGWFLLLAIGAGLLAPVALKLRTAGMPAPVAGKLRTDEGVAPGAVKPRTAGLLAPAAVKPRTDEGVAPGAVKPRTAGLLAPAAVKLRAAEGVVPAAGKLRTAEWVGIAAAAVQVVGLLRWPLIVPFVDDPGTFHTLNVVMGNIVGEACGYVLTAIWTVLVARRMAVLPRVWGFVAAGAIATGLAPALALVNFAGYVLWSLWLIGLGTQQLTRARAAHASR